MITRSTYGRTFVIASNDDLDVESDTFSGSSLNRKKRNTFNKVKFSLEEVKKRLEASKTKPLEKEILLKSMSTRTKQKIKDKLIAFSRQCDNLTFVTLTFANAVEDLQAVNILRKFLDNTKKRSINFQYLWVAER